MLPLFPNFGSKLWNRPARTRSNPWPAQKRLDLYQVTWISAVICELILTIFFPFISCLCKVFIVQFIYFNYFFTLTHFWIFYSSYIILLYNVHFYFVISFSWCVCKLSGASCRLCLTSLWNAPFP